MTGRFKPRAPQLWVLFGVVVAVALVLAVFALVTFISPSSSGSVSANVPNLVTEAGFVLALLGYAVGVARYALHKQPVREIDTRAGLEIEAQQALREISGSRAGAFFNIGFRGARWHFDSGLHIDAHAEPWSHNNLIDYMRIEQARSVLLIGPEGSGKTVLLRRAQEDSLAGDEPDAIACVYLRLPDRDRRSLDAWIADHVTDLFGDDTYRSLLARQRLVVMLDGLDEVRLDERTDLPREHKDLALTLAEIRNSAHQTVVACRDSVAVQVLQESDDDTGWCCAALVPITASEAGVRLRAIEPPLSQPDIAQITDAMTTSAYPAPTPLHLPLYFTLFLHELRLVRTRAAIIAAAVSNVGLVDLLLTRFIGNALARPAAHASGTSRTGQASHSSTTRRRKGREPATGRRYEQKKALAWLTTLAKFTRDHSGTEIYSLTIREGLILPHHLVALVPPARTKAATLGLTAALWAPFFLVLADEASRPQSDWRAYAAAFGIAIVMFALAAVMTVGFVRPIAIVPSRLVDQAGLIRMGMALGVTAATFAYAAFLSSPRFALAYSFSYYIPFGFGYTCATRPTLRPRFVGVVGSVAVAVLCPISTAVFGDRTPASWIACGVLTGVVGLAAAVVLGAKLAKQSAAVLPRGYVPSKDPYYRLRQDKWSAAVIWIVAGGLTFYVLYSGATFKLSALACTVLALLAGLAAGPGLVSVAWRRYLAVLLLSAGKLPLRLKPFLQWARDVEILRRVEGAYAFRHSAVQDFLASHNLESVIGDKQQWPTTD